MRILTASHPPDLEAWRALWSLGAFEPQAHPDYCLLFARANMEACCATWQSGAGAILMPFELRPVGGADDHGVYDAITPYGYGGAYTSGEVDVTSFWESWVDWARQNRVVSLTIRSHLFQDAAAAAEWPTISPFDNVVVDTSIPFEDIWDNLEGRVRTDFRRAEREGVTIEWDFECKRLEEFLHVYTATMSSRKADDFYFFGLDSLRRFTSGLGDRVMLTHAHHQGKIVASEMNLLGHGFAYYFLSGALPEARGSRANPKMKVEVLRWLHDHGYRSYLLGGGMSADDSLFRYKLGYAPKGRVPFLVRYLETLPDQVTMLVRKRQASEPGWIPAGDFLPPYRAPAQTRQG